VEVVRPGMIESRVRRDRLGNRFLLGSLVVWRLTHLIAEEDGPADVVVRMRARAGDGWAGELMDCFYCMSVWVSAPVAVLVARRSREIPLLWIALSGAACLLEQATRERELSIGGGGSVDGLLWQQAEGAIG